MAFGNFRIVLIFYTLLFIIDGHTHAQQKTETAHFLYHQLDQFELSPSASQLLRFSEIIHPKKEKLDTASDQLAWVIVNANIGYYHNQYGNMASAITHYERGWKTFFNKQLKDYDIIENCLQPLGNIYIKIGDLKKAENTIKNYLYIAEKSQNTRKIISGITNLSIAYHNQGNYKKAIKILREGLQIDPENVNILTNLATNHLHANNLLSAEEIATKVILINPDQVNAYQILAATSLEKKDYKSARDYMLISKSHLLKDPNSSARTLAKWQLAYIDLLLSKSEYAEAEKYLKEIYSLLLPEYANEGLPLEKDLIADKILLKALDVHAFIYKNTGESLKAFEAYLIAFEVNAKLNLLYPLQDTKIIQHHQNRNRAEAYIDLSFELYKKTKDQKLVEQAFQVAEYSKAPIINEALISKKILSAYQNDSLVIQQELLNNELALYDTYILKEKQLGNRANINLIQKWSAEYDTKTIELKNTIESLQHKYPQLLDVHEKISVVQLQKRLQKDNTILIEYFFGSKTVYQFIVTPNTLKIQEIQDYEIFKGRIKNYISYFDSPAAINNDIGAFTNDAFKIFRHLHIPDGDINLLIVPDGLLYYLPFETLITRPNTTLDFQKMSFLLNTNQVSYEITASKYLRSAHIENEKNTILGIFPVFEDSGLELPYSLSESAFIKESFDGDFLEKEKATYSHFWEESKKHSIIHLATHANSGSFNKPASVRFRNQDIPINQLYGLQLSSQLIVLSACETGVGKIAKGEGPLSIARGFQYAGIENLLFSLWKVNDKATSLLMKYFYQYLTVNNSKVNAVYQAKLDYINSKDISNAQKSPYYWAAFVYYGEIEKPVTNSYSWYTIITILGFLVVFLSYKFLRRS